MFSSLTSIRVSPALTATSRCFAVLEMAHKQIVAGKRMVICAMSYFTKLFNPATIGIFTSCKESEMVWINTGCIPAKVIYREFIRNITDEKQVSNSMRFLIVFLSELLTAHLSITNFVFSSIPIPASGGLIKADLCNKPIDQRFGLFSSWHKQKATHAQTVKWADEWPQSERGLRNVVSSFLRPLQGRNSTNGNLLRLVTQL